MADAMRFGDGEGYEAMMGIWSALSGTNFLDWLDVPDGSRWANIGCGNGASTELIVRQTSPSSSLSWDKSGSTGGGSTNTVGRWRRSRQAESGSALSLREGLARQWDGRRHRCE
jgi:hypothetical protein